jgi:hypothetical protein
MAYSTYDSLPTLVLFGTLIGLGLWQLSVARRPRRERVRIERPRQPLKRRSRMP